MHPSAVVVLCAAALISAASAELRQSLNGAGWSVVNANGSIQISGTVPGGIYSDLRAAGVLEEDIYYRFNDDFYRWVSYDNWTYSTTFLLNAAMRQKRNITLHFEGVDTIADIYVNGNNVGSTENMFVRYYFPIKDYIQIGLNTLEVRFQSAVDAALQLYQAEDYIVPPECVPDEYNGECHVNFLRKMQSSFSWDWGPAYPSVAIWKNVEIIGSDSAFLQDYYVYISYDIESNRYLVNQTVELGGDTNFEELIFGMSFLPEGSEDVINVINHRTTVAAVATSSAVTYLDANDILLWWPNGLGNQYQYNTFVELVTEDGTASIEKKVGYRNISIVQEPVAAEEEMGLTFYLEVNGVPVFAKGSNWIPSHVLAELSSDENRIRSLMSAAREANMNMLRVWGGGLYESDLFYEIADEMGIMIWQDLMFACSMYPTNPNFLENVEQELADQLKRLMHHPSIVIWAGNNENEGALRDDWYGTSTNFNLYYADYVTLYVDTIAPLVQELDPSRLYVLSSPSNGIRTIEEGYVSEQPSNPLYGDVHYYNYDSDGWNYTTFPIPRFASEYGYQSLPSVQTLSSIAVTTDLSVGSELMQSRQHHDTGYVQMAQQIIMHLPLPDDYETAENFRTFVYFSQINQAMSTKTETEHYRRNRNKLSDSGEGYTMGALYWQLNDIWEAPSWSSIDFLGRWKMLHYYAKNFFSDVLISPYITPEGNLVVSLISDLQYDVDSVTMNIYIYRWDSFEYVKTVSENHDLRNLQAYDAFSSTLEDVLDVPECTSNGDSRNTCFIYCTLLDAEGNKISPDNFVFPGDITAAIQIQIPSFEVLEVTGPTISTDYNIFDISISSDNIAPFVWLEVQGIFGHFSDNGFLLVEPTYNIQFYTEDDVTAEELQSAISITSVMSTNH